jgi:hypothetical protein
MHFKLPRLPKFRQKNWKLPQMPGQETLVPNKIRSLRRPLQVQILALFRGRNLHRRVPPRRLHNFLEHGNPSGLLHDPLLLLYANPGLTAPQKLYKYFPVPGGSKTIQKFPVPGGPKAIQKFPPKKKFPINGQPKKKIYPKNFTN